MFVYNGTPFTVKKISPLAGIELGPLDQKASAKPTELPVLPMHRKRGFITSANSDDTDQLLHLSSYIGVFSTFASTRYHENHTFERGKCLHCWGVQAELSLLFVHATRHHSVMLNIYLSGNADYCAPAPYHVWHIFFLILVKIYEGQLGNQVC